MLSLCWSFLHYTQQPPPFLSTLFRDASFHRLINRFQQATNPEGRRGSHWGGTIRTLKNKTDATETPPQCKHTDTNTHTHTHSHSHTSTHSSTPPLPNSQAMFPSRALTSVPCLIYSHLMEPSHSACISAGLPETKKRHTHTHRDQDTHTTFTHTLHANLHTHTDLSSSS